MNIFLDIYKKNCFKGIYTKKSHLQTRRWDLRIQKNNISGTNLQVPG